jgi:hypothetical protein
VQLQAQFFISLAKFWCSICKHELILPFLQPFGKISANLGCAVAWAGPMLDEPTRPFILSTTFSMIISSSPSISLPKGKSQISTNSVSLNGDGTVNFSSYVENNDFLDTLMKTLTLFQLHIKNLKSLNLNPNQEKILPPPTLTLKKKQPLLTYWQKRLPKPMTRLQDYLLRSFWF